MQKCSSWTFPPSTYGSRWKKTLPVSPGTFGNQWLMGILPAWVSQQLWKARPICLRLFWHLARAAASRTFWTAGSNSPISTAMMAMTTSSSMSVNPRRRAVMVRFPGGRAARRADVWGEV